MIGIYCRVSSEEQANHGYSIEDQLAKCREKAGTHDVVEYVDPGVSGQFLDRPALNKLRKDIKDGLIDKVICYDPDRLSRKLVNQLLVTEEIEKNAVLTFVNGNYQKTPEGMMFYQMRGAFAEFEKAKITERMSNGRKRKAQEGKVVRDPQLYGYNYDKKAANFNKNETESKVVQLIFDLFTHPEGRVRGMNGICRYLNDHKVATKRRHSSWCRQTVRQILMNEAYIGNFYNNKWDTRGMLANKHLPKEEHIRMKLRPKSEWILIKIPPIIDEETFRYAQNLLSQSRRRWSKRSIHNYLLSGLVRCGDCGNTMTGVWGHVWDRKVRFYTDRKNQIGAAFKGCGNKVYSDVLEKEIWDKIVGWLDHPEEIAAASDQVQERPFEANEEERIKSEIEKIKSGRKRLLSLFADGVDSLSSDDIRESLKSFKEKEDDLYKQLDVLHAKMDRTSGQQHSQAIYKDAVNYYLKEKGEGLSFDDQQQLIRMLVKEILVYKDGHFEIRLF